MSNLSDRYIEQGLDVSSAQVEYISDNGTTQTGSISGSDIPLAAAALQPRNIVPAGISSEADLLRVEVSDGSSGWLDAAAVFPDHTVGVSAFGIRTAQGAGDSLDITFGADGADSSTTWASLVGWSWRIRRASPNAPAGLDSSERNLTKDASTGGVVVGAGHTLLHPYLEISTGDTYTVEGRMLVDQVLSIAGSLEVVGTTIVEDTDNSDIDARVDVLDAQKPSSMVRLSGGAGHGSTGIRVRNFLTQEAIVGSDIIYNSDGINGDTFTVNADGIYSMSYWDARTTAGTDYFGISLNANADTIVAFTSLSPTCKILVGEGSDVGMGIGNSCSVTVRLSAGDVIRAHTNGQVNATGAYHCGFVITQIIKY